MEVDRIICGDCLEIMPTLPEKSIDLIIADPPYNTGNAEWDKIKNYDEWMGQIFKECERVLKANGSFYWFHNQISKISRLVIWLEENTNFEFKQFIVWNKKFKGCKKEGFLQGVIEGRATRNYLQLTEYLLFYTFQSGTGLNIIQPFCFEKYLDYMIKEKNKLDWSLMKINQFLGYKEIAAHWFAHSQPRFISKKDYIKLQTTGFFQKSYEDLRSEYDNSRKKFDHLRYTFNNQKTHHNVWDFDITKKTNHYTPKPIELIKNIILHSSNEGDLVLDPFLGSGTTALVCKKLNRKFIGIEINPEYVELARKRKIDNSLFRIVS